MTTDGHSPFLPEDAPADPTDARRVNRTRLLRSIVTRGPATRAELSRRIGLSRPTVSVITNELLSAGLLSEGERVSSGGAPGTLLEISKDTGVTIVGDIRTPARLRLAAVGVSGEVLGEATVATTSSQDILEAIADFVHQAEPGSALGVSLAVRGWVTSTGEWQRQELRDADPQLAQTLRRRLRLPVFAVNAVDAMTVADLRDSPSGLAAQATLVLEERIGMGLTIGGRLRVGLNRPVGDISHVVPGTPGPPCAICGHCCLQEQVLPLRLDTSPSACATAAAALGGLLAPIAGAVELEEIVLARFPDQISAELAGLLHGELVKRMPEYQVPMVRVSARGDEAVLVGAAMMMLYRSLG